MIHKKLPTNLSRFIWHFLQKHKPTVAVYALLSFAAGFWGPFNSVLLRQVINLLPDTKSGDIGMLILPTSLIVINFIIFDNFTWRGITYTRYKILPFILNKIDRTLLNYTLQHSHQFFTQNMAGTLSKQIFHLIDGVEKIISSSIPNLLRAVSLLTMAFVFAYHVNPIFLNILALWSICFFGISLFMSEKLTHLSKNQADTESVLGGQIIDSITNSFNVTLFAQRKEEINRRESAFLAYANAYQKKEKHALIMHSIQGGLIAIMMAFSCYFLLRLYAQNLVTIGDFALILALSMETGHMMWFTMYEVDEFNKAAGRCKQSLSCLVTPIEIQDKSSATNLLNPKGEITFNHVKFHYKGTKPLFEDISIKIQAGEKVGLVGYSGGGKSTFVNLILRLFEINSGEILIDGQNIQDITQDSLRENIAMIPQDPSLFHRSLMENIRYGKTCVSDEDVITAAKKAYADGFISHLPQSYDSLVGDRGVKLSGGQRQRIAIARAILKNAPILILDEATSQLDSITEKLIQESLWELMKDKTTIVIAHRLSTLLHMDRILVFDQGKIIADGPHKELLSNNNLYATLWETQTDGILNDS